MKIPSHLCAVVDVHQPMCGLQLCLNLPVFTGRFDAVVREFIPPAPGELPPEVAHSPMKPLGQEISHRVQMLINLYPPQRVAWGAFVDLSKVVRPLRAKNHAKRLKYKEYKDIYYSED